jgi:hypothetical protein
VGDSFFFASYDADVSEGAFTDYGIWRSAACGGYKNLPDGYWAYVCPPWYIFKETSEPKETEEAAK